MEVPLVSVVMITYGHEKFIEEAINGVLMQKCNFAIELIVANDCSPDNTDEVIRSIVKNDPKGNCIIYLKHERNIGMIPNFILALNETKCKYIALCEGDDYWTDPFKLQKQVDFLESNPDYSMSCHNANIIYENSNKKSTIFSRNNVSYDISLQTIVEKWVIPTASMVFRREYIVNLPEWFSKIYSGDFTLALLLRYYGKIRFFKDIMSVYRMDLYGSSASATFRTKGMFVLKQHILLLNYFNLYTKFQYEFIINRRISQIKNELQFMELKEKGLFNVFLKMPFVFFRKGFIRFFSLLKYV
jgi:glycosyltransferase involved in cell wall biosynthesis